MDRTHIDEKEQQSYETIIRIQKCGAKIVGKPKDSNPH